MSFPIEKTWHINGLESVSLEERPNGFSVLEIIFGKVQGTVANLLQTPNTDLPAEPPAIKAFPVSHLDQGSRCAGVPSSRLFSPVTL